MRVVVDTSVWSLALRRRSPVPSPHTLLLTDLIQDGRALLLGLVRQELLSGIRHPEQFNRLREQLRSFPDGQFETEDFETAASFFNLCMSNGIQGSMIDFLICAFASRRHYQIFTSDPDFDHYSEVLPISLLRPQTPGRNIQDYLP
jgi:predicted nucleic acid-binding protein